MAQTILVIDDSASLRQVVAMALQGAGYDVIQAGDAAVPDGVEQAFGQTAEAKAAAGDQHVVAQESVERGGSIGIEFLHRKSTPADKNNSACLNHPAPRGQLSQPCAP